MGRNRKRIRERISREELTGLSENGTVHLLMYWDLPEDGDAFVMKDEADGNVYFVVDVSGRDEEYYIYYNHGGEKRKVPYGDVLPLFSIGQLIDMLNYDGCLHIVNGSVVTADYDTYMPAEGEDLCATLWRAVLGRFN